MEMFQMTSMKDTISIATDMILSDNKAGALAALCTAMTLDKALKTVSMLGGPKVGDIVYTSWGYDQTNIDFYQVVKVTKASVKLQRIAATVESSTGYDDYLTPLKDKFLTAAEHSWRKNAFTTRFKLDESGIGYSCRADDHTAWLWDGTAKRQTGANYGH